MPPGARQALVIAAAALATAACGDAGVTTERADAAPPSASEPSTTAEAPSPTEPAPLTTEPPSLSPAAGGSLEWQENTGDLETALLEVPVDYEDPDGPTFELFLARRPADDQANKVGSLLVNPGGPGFGGTELVLIADQLYGDALLERFDIVGWDPRGTGLSEPAIDCIDDYDRYFAEPDVTPDDEAERQTIIDLAEEFAADCEANNAAILPYITTNNSARDMDAIRQALGEDEISYFGFSYGSELGATWATLFPETVRAAVLDGAADPTADALESNIQQSQGFEATLDTFLAQCSADPSCAFHNEGDAAGAFDALMAALDESPAPTEPGRPPANLAVFRRGVVRAMYDEGFWDQLAEALADAQAGVGAGLLALHDAYYERREDGTWGNELEAFQSIRCMDQVERPTVEESDTQGEAVREAAPRISPSTSGDYFCTFFPESIEPRAEITGAGAGPILVVGTTGDAATPLESTRAMAATLEDSRLVVVDADRHTGYGINECVVDVVDSYLVDLVVPSGETSC